MVTEVDSAVKSVVLNVKQTKIAQRLPETFDEQSIANIYRTKRHFEVTQQKFMITTNSTTPTKDERRPYH